MLKRLRTDQDGFGLIELIMALTLLNIGILATVAALNSGAIALKRASKASTATAIADAHMERFRAITYDAISLLDTSVSTADADTSYYGDSARRAGATMTTAAACTSPSTETCQASQTISGPDHQPYRVDTYIFTEAPLADSRPLKIVTVVVRDGRDLTKSLVRTESTFDLATGTAGT